MTKTKVAKVEGVTPLRNQVFARVIRESDVLLKGPGGTLYTPTVKDSEPYCEIIAVGPEVKNIKSGDYALIGNPKPVALYPIEEEEYIFMSDYDFSAIIDSSMIKYFVNKRSRVINTPKDPLN